ncbi:hypothetical protein IAR55_003127 [Kwoniella newhampshirensis]|uniref:BZIP domain-containing protein n=1 Tax=Kwoniella newhampshirensis TaxID=1651941 RepID=A0AAW0YPU1_9TREE
MQQWTSSSPLWPKAFSHPHPPFDPWVTPSRDYPAHGTWIYDLPASTPKDDSHDLTSASDPLTTACSSESFPFFPPTPASLPPAFTPFLSVAQPDSSSPEPVSTGAEAARDDSKSVHLEKARRVRKTKKRRADEDGTSAQQTKKRTRGPCRAYRKGAEKARGPPSWWTAPKGSTDLNQLTAASSTTVAHPFSATPTATLPSLPASSPCLPLSTDPCHPSIALFDQWLYEGRHEISSMVPQPSSDGSRDGSIATPPPSFAALNFDLDAIFPMPEGDEADLSFLATLAGRGSQTEDSFSNLNYHGGRKE